MEDRIPHAPAKFRFAARPTISSPRVRVLRLVRNTLWERERRLRMRPKRSPLNRAWSRCPVIIVSSTSITCSASDAHRHTLSVKSTGRVEKRAVFGKNGHHHRDRDGRIALGAGDRATSITCSAGGVQQHTLSVKSPADVHEKSRCREILMSFSGPGRPNCSRPINSRYIPGLVTNPGLMPP